MSKIFGVGIQISGFLSDSTKTTIPKTLFPLNAKIRRNSASVCPPSRATREVLPFPNSGRFFHKRRYFFQGRAVFFRRRFPRHAATMPPCGAGMYFFFAARRQAFFRAARGGKASVRGAGVFFLRETHIPQLFPHGRARLLQKNFGRPNA